MKPFAFAAFVVLLSGLAFGSSPKQLATPVGYTTTLSMPSTVTRVRVSDGSLLEATRKGHQVKLVGLSKGLTDVTVTTAEGETTLRVYVAADRYGMPQK